MYQNGSSHETAYSLENDPDPSSPTGAARPGQVGDRTVAGAAVTAATPFVVAAALTYPVVATVAVAVVVVATGVHRYATGDTPVKDDSRPDSGRSRSNDGTVAAD